MRDVLSAFLLSFAFDAGRYALTAAPAFFIFWTLYGERLRTRWLRPSPPDRAAMRRELLASLRTAMIFASVGVAVFFGTGAGIFRIHHGGVTPWVFVAPVVLIVLQDAYFYFTHRVMHHRLLFRAVHLEHHLSRHTSPFTAYAFSPIEAFVHAAFVPLVTLILPVHEIALFVFLGYMIVRNVLGHLGIELMPRGFIENRFGALHTTTTHHALHHLRPGTNFGLYFTLWDDVCGTTDRTYAASFRRAVEGEVTTSFGRSPLRAPTGADASSP